MKLWLDDERPAPDGWVHVYTGEDAIRLLSQVTEISFDNDLGHPYPVRLEGRHVANEIEKRCALGLMGCPKWHVHTGNPVARKLITQAMQNAERYSQ